MGRGQKGVVIREGVFRAYPFQGGAVVGNPLSPEPPHLVLAHPQQMCHKGDHPGSHCLVNGGGAGVERVVQIKKQLFYHPSSIAQSKNCRKGSAGIQKKQKNFSKNREKMQNKIDEQQKSWYTYSIRY
jgi:hypothetical protein